MVTTTILHGSNKTLMGLLLTFLILILYMMTFSLSSCIEHLVQMPSDVDLMES
jgi:hypothetical protein